MEWSPGHFGKNLKQMSACSGVMINLALNRSNAKAISCQHSALLSMCWHWSNHLHACARVANTSPLLTPACSNVDDKGPCKDTNLATVSAMRALVASSAGSHCWQVWHMEAAAATGNQRASSGSTVVSTEAPEKRRWARHNSEIALCVANGPRPRRNTSAPLRFFRRGSIRGPPPAAETIVEAETAWNNKRDVGSLGTNSGGSNNAARNLTRGACSSRRCSSQV